MKNEKTLIDWEYRLSSEEQLESLVVSFSELELLFISGKFLKHIFKYRESFLFTYRYAFINNPFLKSLAIWLLSRGPSHIKDQRGTTIRISIPLLAEMLYKYIKDLTVKPFYRIKARTERHFLNPPQNCLNTCRWGKES